MKILAYKEKRAYIGPLVMILLILLLIAAASYRLITSLDKYGPTLIIVLSGLTFVGLYYLIMEIITLIKFLKFPKILIEASPNELLVYTKKGKETINLEKISKVEKGLNQNYKLLFYRADLIIRCNNQMYKIEYVKDIDMVIEEINNLLKNNY